MQSSGTCGWPGGPLSEVTPAVHSSGIGRRRQRRLRTGTRSLDLATLIGGHWRTGVFPRAWLTSVIQPIPKIPRPLSVDDFRSITLANAVYKLLAKYLHGLLLTVLPPLPWYQAGFQPQRGTYDHVLVLRKVLDERWRAGDAVHVLALDIRGAFPNVTWREIAAVLLQRGMPPFLLNRITSLALTDFTSIRCGRTRTGEVRTGRGVKQGCTLALHWVVATAVAQLPRFSLHLDSPDFTPLLLAYADDLLLASTDRQDLEDFLAAFVEAAACVGLDLNFHKCNYLLRVPGAPDPLPRPVILAGREVQQVDRLLYLGALITSRLDRRGVTYHRITKAHRAVAALGATLRRHPLPRSVVLRIYQSCILPSISYAQATSATIMASRSTLRRQAAIMVGALLIHARRAAGRFHPLRLHGVDKTTSSITRAIRASRIRYWAHVRRSDPAGPLQRVLDFDLFPRRKPGRPCHTVVESLNQDLAQLGAPPAGWEALAMDKDGLAAHLRTALLDDVSSNDRSDSDGSDWDGEELELPSESSDEDQ
ncbi:uncharacterized protein LOC127752028 [Frankliniella occidentalis]|uniref:Uncharacterized protein LOC127752028 n=1 Tax=Frankliniella occidentalis TaxID=133901 RepID=A0A9C6XCB2_FRAOC|nr:uncharacterized protein LOC127752028 [Frankliniella occidentalis]